MLAVKLSWDWSSPVRNLIGASQDDKGLDWD